LSGRIRILPGCRSPWKKPCCRTIRTKASAPRLAISFRSSPAALRPSTSDTFNPSISSIIERVNEMYHYKELDTINENQFRQAIQNLLLVMAPFTPHVCEELWQQLGMEGSIHKMAWPDYDEAALVKDTVEIVVQINGKIKDKILVPTALSPKELEERALENEKIQTLVAGMTVIKVIAVPGKLVNIVVKP